MKGHSSPLHSGLNSSQIETFQKDGFLIIPSVLSPSTISSLLCETHSLLDEFSIEDHPMTRFSTGEGGEATEHVGDDYFLNSGDKIRFFFEEDAFDSSGALTRPKEQSINKIGHSIHTLSPAFRSLTLSPYHAALTTSLGFRNPLVLQSMVICKQPHIGGRVPPHQDSTFLYTDPPSAVGFWYALEDAGGANGGLSFWKGSHLRRGIRKRFVRKEVGGTGFEDVQPSTWPDDGLKYEKEVTDDAESPEGQYGLAEVKAGSLVLIHGNTMHKSERNTSGHSRFIYTFHVIEGAHLYDEKNWLQPGEVSFSRLT
ncbi:MAG: hypothetical protein M1817_003445 [Caeruleum heppii]|nr:MAG: hypothetical protein M1817_003445 [Caeruleum heppii]